MALEGDQPRQAGSGRTGEERAGGVSVVSVQSTLLLEAHRRSEEAEAVRGILQPHADLGGPAIPTLSEDSESQEAVAAQYRCVHLKSPGKAGANTGRNGRGERRPAAV
jgi:hypothetical protein